VSAYTQDIGRRFTARRSAGRTRSWPGRHESAATIAGFALSPLTTLAVPELNTAIAHLRNVLGEATYESLARKGETMTTAAMATYAYGQIDQARAELNAASK